MTGQLSLGGLGGIVLSPDALEEQRGAWCSPVEYTEAAGHFDLDPFTNPRSTLRASYACMLERGGDGFGGTIIKKPRKGEYAVSGNPGTFYIPKGAQIGSCELPCCGGEIAAVDQVMTAGAGWKVWIQPDYEFVRLDTSTLWFAQLWDLCEVIMVPKRDRLAFVPPPGVVASSNPFPHGCFYKRAADVTDAMRALCYPWPCPSYPWGDDPLSLVTVPV